jgi:MFS family permease
MEQQDPASEASFSPHYESPLPDMYLIIALSIAVHSAYVGSKVTISLFALDAGAGPVVVGVLAALYGVMPLLLGVYSGRLADTSGMRRPMYIGAAFISAAMLVGYFGQHMAALFITAIMVGAGFVLFNVAIQNLAGAYGDPTRRAHNFSLLSIGYSASTFIGPMFAGYSIQYAGHAYTFLFLSIFPLLSIIGLMLRPDLARIGKRPAGEPQRKAMDLLRLPALRSLIITSGIIVSASELFAFYVPIHAHAAGLEPSRIGLILGVYATAAIVTRLAFPAIMRRWRGDQVLFASMLVAAAGFVIFPLFPQLVALLAVAFLIGLGLGCGQPLSMMMSFERSPPGRTGEVTGLRLMANNVARILVPLAAGVLGSVLGTSAVFWLNALNLGALSFMSRRQNK